MKSTIVLALAFLLLAVPAMAGLATATHNDDGKLVITLDRDLAKQVGWGGNAVTTVCDGVTSLETEDTGDELVAVYQTFDAEPGSKVLCAWEITGIQGNGSRWIPHNFQEEYAELLAGMKLVQCTNQVNGGGTARCTNAELVVQ